jgi:hypothetical protein
MDISLPPGQRTGGARVSITEENETDILDSALPQHPQKRDAMGSAFFYHHFAMMIYILAGWAVPFRPALWFYVFFIPSVVLQWRVNKNTCILNNIETMIRTGKWRNIRNTEEGGWLWTLARKLTGWNIPHFAMDIFIYSLMGTFLLLGLSHLNGWLFWG